MFECRLSRIIASFYIHTKSRSFCVGNEVRDRNITGYLYSVGLKNQTSYSFIISPPSPGDQESTWKICMFSRTCVAKVLGSVSWPILRGWLSIRAARALSGRCWTGMNLQSSSTVLSEQPPWMNGQCSDSMAKHWRGLPKSSELIASGRSDSCKTLECSAHVHATIVIVDPIRTLL